MHEHSQARQPSARAKPMSTRGGKVSALLIGLLVLLVLAIGGIALLGGRGRPEVEPVRSDSSDRGPVQAMLEPPTPRTEAEVAANAPRPAAGYPHALRSPERYSGTARVEVHLALPPGLAVPERWSIAFQRSRSLIGAEFAVPRTVEVTGASASTVIDDVALGGYDVRPVAEGMNGRLEQVSLRRPDELDVVLRLELYERGFLTGRVVDPDSTPVAGIDVVAESAEDGSRRTVATDASGAYLFERLPDGDWRLFVGSSVTPLASASDVSFAAPSLHMRDLVTPRLGTLVLRVADANGLPVPSVVVEGTGLPSGPLTLVTDLDGRATARHCAAGDVALYATGPRGGRGDLKVHYDPANPGELTLLLGP